MCSTYDISSEFRENHLANHLCNSSICNDPYFIDIYRKASGPYSCLSTMCKHTYRFLTFSGPKDCLFTIKGAEDYAKLKLTLGTFINHDVQVGFHKGLQYIVTPESVWFCPDCSCSIPNKNLITSWKDYKSFAKAPLPQVCDFRKMYAKASESEQQDMIQCFNAMGIDFDRPGHLVLARLVL